MILRSNKLLSIGLLISMSLAIPAVGTAAEASSEKPVVNTVSLPAQHVADLIPGATDLSIRLVELKQKHVTGPNLSAVENRLNEIAADLKVYAERLEALKESTGNRYYALVRLGQELKRQRQPLDRAVKPVAVAVRKLENRFNAWWLENRRWQQIRSGVDTGTLPHEVETTLTRAQATIDEALALIRQALQPMLALQEKAAQLRIRLETMAAEVQHYIRFDLDIEQTDTYPPLASSAFLMLLKEALAYQFQAGFDRIDWDFRSFTALFGRLIIIQAVIALVLIAGIFRHRKTLARTQRLRFLARRPFAAGTFIAIEPFYAFYESGPTWLVLLITVGAGLSGYRLAGGLFENRWKKQALVGLIFILIAARALIALAPPLPIIRLVIALTSAAGIYFCLHWARAARRQADASFFPLALRLGACALAVVLAAELWGRAIEVIYVLFLPMRTIALTIAVWLMMRMARGLLEWVIYHSDWHLPGFVRQNPETAVRRAAGFGYPLFGVFYVSVVLVIWDVYPDPIAALAGLLTLSFSIGSQRISVGLVAQAGILAYGAFVASWAIQQLLLEKVYNRRKVDAGVRFSINRLIHYIIVLSGFLMALTVLGITLTQLTIIISALGVGIGFGLQGIVNNFISGLILLFERPLRVGDTIELKGQWSQIKKIGLRATQVRTYDNADVIVPNNDLTALQVTNWTLHSRMMRLKIPVGVAYGSDVPLVIETLLHCAKDHGDVSARPQPDVLFLSFGDSTLNFELRVWISDFENHVRVKSELHQMIDRQFRLTGIEIAFPQRDLHLRSVDDSLRAGLLKPAE